MAKTNAQRQAEYRARQGELMTKATLDAYFIGRNDQRSDRGFRSVQSLRDALALLDTIDDLELTAMLDRTFIAGGAGILQAPTP